MFESELDQAAGLRRLVSGRVPRILPVLGVDDPAARALLRAMGRAFERNGWRTRLVDGHRDDAIDTIDGLLRDARAGRGLDLALVDAPKSLAGELLAQSDAEVLVLCGPGRDGLAAAYACVKGLVCEHRLQRFRILHCGVAEMHALPRHRRLARVAGRFLAVHLAYAGAIEAVPGAEREQRNAVRPETGGDPLAGLVDSARRWDLAALASAAAVVH